MTTHSMTRRDVLRFLSLMSAAGTTASRAPRAMAATAPAPESRDARVHDHTHAATQPQLRMGSEQIGILVYPEFTALDALGPHYALAGMMGASVRFVAKSLDLVPCEGGARGGFQVKPQLTFDRCPEGLDLLLVPGGLTGTMAVLGDNETLDFLRRAARTAKLVGSVCTGSLVLGAAGLLRGRRATSHWQTLKVLEAAGATPVAERIVFDGADRVTAAGVCAGLDLGLELVRRYRGDFYARGVQLLGEYDPQPPFPGGGSPKTADPVVVEMLNTMHAPLMPRFTDAVSRALARAPRT